MAEKIRFSIRLGAILLAFALSACQKPQLRSERSGETDEEKADAEEDFREIRKSVIGQHFETLTLGSRQFANAEVRDITDEEIVIAHAGGVEKVPWSEVPDEVREKWGYNPSARSLMAKLTTILPKTEQAPPAENPKPSVVEEPKIDRQKLVKEIARQQKMLDSQLVGMRSIESDLARHSQRLAELRNKLHSLRAQQSRTRSGGIFVERINGKSKRVDRSQEAAEVESKMKVEEQLVAQFTKSLQAARSKYQSMKLALDQLRAQ